MEIVNYMMLASDLVDQAIEELTVLSLSSPPAMSENDLVTAYKFVFCDEPEWRENREFWCDLINCDQDYPKRRALEKGFTMEKYRNRMQALRLRRKLDSIATQRNYKRWMRERKENEKNNTNGSQENLCGSVQERS